MTETPQPQKRVRINVATSVKGQHTFDVTVEMSDQYDPLDGSDITGDAVLAESKRLVEILDARYPHQEI